MDRPFPLLSYDNAISSVDNPLLPMENCFYKWLDRRIKNSYY